MHTGKEKRIKERESWELLFGGRWGMGRPREERGKNKKRVHVLVTKQTDIWAYKV